MAEYVLTARAEADLVEIARYTRREWGDRQRDKYIRELFDLFSRIAEQPELASNRDDIRPDLKSRRHRKTHVVFYRMEGKRVEVLRILHTRRDVERAFRE
jgi:toxin ParE1/3/4